MNIIKRATLLELAEAHGGAAVAWARKWIAVASKAQWTNLGDVRRTFSTADQVGACLIFDKGNEYRLIVRVKFAKQENGGTIFIKHFLTHAEYDKNNWKDCCQ